MTFTDAYKEMIAGKKIRRHGFKGYWYISPETGLVTIHLAGTKANPVEKDITYGKLDITIKNCAASDWEVVEA